MAGDNKERRRMFDERICYICLCKVPPTKGVYDAWLGILTCQGDECRALSKKWGRDYTHSPRGKWRPKHEVLQSLRECRPHKPTLSELEQEGVIDLRDVTTGENIDVLTGKRDCEE